MVPTTDLPWELQPVTRLRGVGPQLADTLARIGILTLQDLLFHLPLRYRDRTRITPVGALELYNDVVIEGVIRASDVVFGKRRSLVCRLQDGTGLITLRFFHFSNAQKDNLKAGTRIRCFGEARRGASGLEMYHPEYQVLQEHAPLPLETTLSPVYPATEGLQQVRLRKLMEQLLPGLAQNAITDWLPAHLHGFQVSLADALRYLHQPPIDAPLSQLSTGKHPFQQRLAFEELLAHHLSLLRLRAGLKQETALSIPHNAAIEQQFLATLPFALTNAQKKVSAEIQADIANTAPMLRLVQGDVGSGKTLVAALAALQAIAAGKQVAIMAPTEILAAQHYANFERWFKPLGFNTGFLTGAMRSKPRAQTLAGLHTGALSLVVGTHALFQEDVQFAQLALVIIDEQHRFGVHQRLLLREKGMGEKGLGEQFPHQLIMTATPIPRTLAMSAYADLDCSVIDELPPGRTPVNTLVIDNRRRDEVIASVKKTCAEQRQVYWVCTLIEESEVLQCQAAEVAATELAAALPELRISLVHGRMKPKDKEAVMLEFKQGTIDVLVATTVIEVGVDVPNASLMVIENPERLGLAQLHQLRGRVGRGAAASHCMLLYSAPLSQNARERLQAMRDSNDGFVIAEKDLALRGPGEMLGTRQTGALQFHIADLQRDANLLPAIKTCAEYLSSDYPAHIEPLIRRWLGEGERYAQA